MKHFFVIVVLLFVGCAPRSVHDTVLEKVAKEEKLRALLNESIRHFRSNKPESLSYAEAALRVAQELSPKDARVLDGIGSVYLRRGKLDFAKKYFQKAILASPRYDRPYAHLAIVAEAENNLIAAVELLQRAIVMNPLNARARVSLAYFVMRHNSSREAKAYAQQELRKAYQVQPFKDPELKKVLDELSKELN